MVYPYNEISALKMNKILTHATIWMNFKGIMLSVIIQTQKDKYCTISLIWGTYNNHGKWVLSINGYRVSVREDKKSSEDGW